LSRNFDLSFNTWPSVLAVSGTSAGIVSISGTSSGEILRLSTGLFTSLSATTLALPTSPTGTNERFDVVVVLPNGTYGTITGTSAASGTNTATVPVISPVNSGIVTTQVITGAVTTSGSISVASTVGISIGTLVSGVNLSGSATNNYLYVTAISPAYAGSPGTVTLSGPSTLGLGATSTATFTNATPVAVLLTNVAGPTVFATPAQYAPRNI
jgi:hypothetical protein